MTRSIFITECLDKGFAIRKDRDGKIIARKKNKDGMNLMFKLTKGGTIAVFEDGQKHSRIFTLDEFEIHD